MTDKKHDEVRRPYTAPELVKVNLIADEAVLGGCKHGNATGPFKNSCAPGQGCPDNKGS